MLLKNEKLLLRALEPTDLEILYEWENDPKNWETGNTLAPYSKYVLHQYIENSQVEIQESRQLRLMIQPITDDFSLPVGTIDLFNIDFHNSRAGIGILINGDENRQKGYAANAIKLLEDYSQNHLLLNQLHCEISEENIPSLNLFKKMGYQVCGKLLQWRKTSKGWKNVIVLQHVFG